MYTFWSTVCTKSIIDNNWVQRTLRIWWNYVIIAFVNSFVNICSIYENHIVIKIQIFIKVPIQIWYIHIFTTWRLWEKLYKMFRKQHTSILWHKAHKTYTVRGGHSLTPSRRFCALLPIANVIVHHVCSSCRSSIGCMVT